MRKIIRKYYPHRQIPDTEERKQTLAIAKNYKSPHEWIGEREKTRSLATEPSVTLTNSMQTVTALRLNSIMKFCLS